MRKVSIALASCAALVAAMAFSASALAVVDERCDGDPYPNDFAVHDFTIATTDSDLPHFVSGVTGSGLVCGTEIEPGLVGEETLNDNARIKTPPGVEINETGTTSIPDTAYVGNGTIHVASWTGAVAGLALIIPQSFTLRSDAISECERENGLLEGGPEPGTMTACYKGSTFGVIPGHNWNFVLKQDGSYTLIIGPFYNDLPQEWPAGLTSIDEFTLCDYAGATGEHGTEGTCGDGSDPSKWLQKNGDWSYSYTAAGQLIDERCTGQGSGQGFGRYTVTVTNKGGQTTEPASTCVSWRGHGPGGPTRPLGSPQVGSGKIPTDPGTGQQSVGQADLTPAP